MGGTWLFPHVSAVHKLIDQHDFANFGTYLQEGKVHFIAIFEEF